MLTPFTPQDTDSVSDFHNDVCEVCDGSGELLCCDTCNLAYHLTCLSPPLDSVPNGTWVCPKCKESLPTEKHVQYALAYVQSECNRVIDLRRGLRTQRQRQRREHHEQTNKLSIALRRLLVGATTHTDNLASGKFAPVASDLLWTSECRTVLSHTHLVLLASGGKIFWPQNKITDIDMSENNAICKRYATATAVTAADTAKPSTPEGADAAKVTAIRSAVGGMIGKRVRKYFAGHGFFGGQVTAQRSNMLTSGAGDFDMSVGNLNLDLDREFHIVYDDGDEEDMSVWELAKIIILPKSEKELTIRPRLNADLPVLAERQYFGRKDVACKDDTYSIVFGAGKLGLIINGFKNAAFVMVDEAESNTTMKDVVIGHGHGVVSVQRVDNANASHHDSYSSTGSNERDRSPVAKLSCAIDAVHGKAAPLMPFSDVLEKFQGCARPMCVTFSAVAWRADPEIERGAKDAMLKLKQRLPKRKSSRDSECSDSATAITTAIGSITSAESVHVDSNISSVTIPSKESLATVEPPRIKRARVPI